MAQMVKKLPARQEAQVPSMDREDPPEKGKATHSSIFAWEIPWTEGFGNKCSFPLYLCLLVTFSKGVCLRQISPSFIFKLCLYVLFYFFLAVIYFFLSS